MLPETSKRLRTYELSLREIDEKDIDKLHELSVCVRWPHRPDDWRMLLPLGQGYVGCDEIGRIVASVMWIPMGDNTINICMLITSPRLQTLGAGRWLMKHILQKFKHRHLTLNATKAAYRLYESLSFKPIESICQHQGIASPVLGVSVREEASIRPFTEEDKADLYQLDQDAMGLSRHNILDTLLEKSNSLVMVRQGKVVGFSLCRKFGRGHVIGPVVTSNSHDAIALIAPHVNDHAGNFLRIDTVRDEAVFKNFLSQAGMPEYDTVTRMAIEPSSQKNSGVYTFALGSQALN